MNRPPKQIADRKRYEQSLIEDRQNRERHKAYLSILKDMTERYKRTGTTLTEEQLEKLEQENNLIVDK